MHKIPEGAAHLRVAAQATAHVALRAAHVVDFSHVEDHVAGRAHVVANVADSEAANHDRSQREHHEGEVVEASSKTPSTVRPVTTTDRTLPLREVRRSGREAGARAEEEGEAEVSGGEAGNKIISINNTSISSNSFKVNQGFLLSPCK